MGFLKTDLLSQIGKPPPPPPDCFVKKKTVFAIFMQCFVIMVKMPPPPRDFVWETLVRRTNIFHWQFRWQILSKFIIGKSLVL